MDTKQRAELVRQCRFEMKTKRRPADTGASFYNDRAPRSGEGMRDYVNGAPGGDGSYYDRAARWDRHRAQMPKLRRRLTPRATRDPGGYVGYEGQWANHLGFSTPAARQSTDRRRGLGKRRVLPGRNR